MERKSAEAMKQAAGPSKKKKKKKNPDDVRNSLYLKENHIIGKFSFQAGERSDTDEDDLNPVQKLKRKIGKDDNPM